MYYETSTSHSTYQDTFFVPMFVPQFSSPTEEQAAQATCGINAQCLLDYAATGNVQMASATITSSQAVNSTSRLFGRKL